MRIDAVTFDVGGTLIEPYPSVGHVYAEVAAAHGWKDLAPGLLNQRFRDAWKTTPSFGYTQSAWADLVDETFRGLIPDRPSRSFFGRLYERFGEPDAWRVFDDVLPALDALASAGVRLGVISNWDDRLRGLLERLGLRDYFEATAISCEVGFAKPSPVIFEHAAMKLGVSPAAILHVGDSEEMDVAGARAVGMQATRICRRGLARDGEVSSLALLMAKSGRGISLR